MRQPDDPGVDPVDIARPYDAWLLCALAVLGGPFLLIVITLIFTWPAKAHDWFTNKSNPITHNSCCNGTDCKVIADVDWWREGDNYLVRWFDGKTYSIPATQALPSEDRTGKAAGCVWGGALRCFFLPVTG